MLWALAVGLTRRLPPLQLDPEPVWERLVAATGGSLVVDTPGGRRRRERRLRDAGGAYVRDLEAWWARECTEAQAAELAFVRAMNLLDLPGALDDVAILEAHAREMTVFRRWLHQDRQVQPPWGTTSEFYKMARRHGYPIRRKGRAR
jgi:hypothetical protein